MSQFAASHPLAARYDALWSAAAPEVRRGRVRLDPLPLRKEHDLRRGVTLLARLAPGVAAALAGFCDELRVLEPAQYFHPSADLHLTVLALFTATADYEPFLAHLDGYQSAAAEALDGACAFAVEARGVTLTRDAVLAQGFPRGDTLQWIRERLRAALAARGLGGAVDQRYRLETAHTTLVRFVAPLRDPARFVDALAAARVRAFGTSRISQVELVLADWYQSSELSRPVSTFGLSTASACR